MPWSGSEVGMMTCFDLSNFALYKCDTAHAFHKAIQEPARNERTYTKNACF